MIIGPDFIWLHFPKCGGTAVEMALRKLYAEREDVHFDELNPKNVIWHESISLRSVRDPSFTTDGKQILCCIRRLPGWLLSRVHFEASRAPHRIASRSLLETGRFLEITGQPNHADTYARMYSTPRIDRWLRVENLAEDLSGALSLDPVAVAASLKKENEAKLQYVKNLEFWFTPKQLAELYTSCPLWAEIEQQVYGSILTM